jgi:hypothetical protein
MAELADLLKFVMGSGEEAPALATPAAYARKKMVGKNKPGVVEGGDFLQAGLDPMVLGGLGGAALVKMLTGKALNRAVSKGFRTAITPKDKLARKTHVFSDLFETQPRSVHSMNTRYQSGDPSNMVMPTSTMTDFGPGVELTTHVPTKPTVSGFTDLSAPGLGDRGTAVRGLWQRLGGRMANSTDPAVIREAHQAQEAVAHYMGSTTGEVLDTSVSYQHLGGKTGAEVIADAEAAAQNRLKGYMAERLTPTQTTAPIRSTPGTERQRFTGPIPAVKTQSGLSAEATELPLGDYYNRRQLKFPFMHEPGIQAQTQKNVSTSAGGVVGSEELEQIAKQTETVNKLIATLADPDKKKALAALKKGNKVIGLADLKALALQFQEEEGFRGVGAVARVSSMPVAVTKADVDKMLSRATKGGTKRGSFYWQDAGGKSRKRIEKEYGSLLEGHPEEKQIAAIARGKEVRSIEKEVLEETGVARREWDAVSDISAKEAKSMREAKGTQPKTARKGKTRITPQYDVNVKAAFAEVSAEIGFDFNKAAIEAGRGKEDPWQLVKLLTDPKADIPATMPTVLALIKHPKMNRALKNLEKKISDKAAYKVKGEYTRGMQSSELAGPTLIEKEVEDLKYASAPLRDYALTELKKKSPRAAHMLRRMLYDHDQIKQGGLKAGMSAKTPETVTSTPQPAVLRKNAKKAQIVDALEANNPRFVAWLQNRARAIEKSAKHGAEPEPGLYQKFLQEELENMGFQGVKDGERVILFSAANLTAPNVGLAEGPTNKMAALLAAGGMGKYAQNYQSRESI